MGVWQELTGTVESWFGVGKKATIAVGSDGSNLVFKDEVVAGTKTLTQLLAAGTFDPDTILVDEDGNVMADEDGNVLVSG